MPFVLLFLLRMEVQHSLECLSHVLNDFKEGQPLLLYLHIQEGFLHHYCAPLELLWLPSWCCSGVKLAIGASVILEEVNSLKESTQ